MSLSSLAQVELWVKVTWQNEPAWISHQGGVTAVVSEARGRLVYFGGDPLGATQNLIFVPALGKDITGSHAVWLGPQTLWGWPAPKDWDSPPVKVVAAGESLTLTEPQTDPTYPHLTRTYIWQSGKLACGVTWSQTDKPYYAMQIIQVPATAQCSLKLEKSTTLPQGAVLVEQNVHANPSFTTPTSGFKLSEDGTAYLVTPEEQAIKVGFVPQPIIAQEGDWILTIARGDVQGTIQEGPDFGCFTQIWSGSPQLGYFEAEQFSPVLTPASAGAASFTILLDATKPSL